MRLRCRAPRSPGRALAGALIKILGAPIAIAFDAILIAGSVMLLRGIRVNETVAPAGSTNFMTQLREGVNFVARTRMLWTLALFVGCWQLLHHMASVVQILVATRELGMTAQAIGLCYVGMGVGTILASVYGKRVSEKFGPGPTIVAGIAVSAAGWLALAVAPANVWGVVFFGFMLTCFSGGATLIFVNFLSLRQAVTPEPLVGAHDQHDALADPDRCRPRCADRWLRRRAHRATYVARTGGRGCLLC